jgi:hypothetical protein
MSDDASSKLSKILARDNEVRAAEASKKEAQEEAGKAAAIVWKRRIQEELIPAMAPIAKSLEGAGWVCRVEQPEYGLKITIYRGDMLAYGARERPFISFNIVKGWNTVGVIEATPSGSGSSSEGFTVDISAETFTEKVVEFVGKLARK